MGSLLVETTGATLGATLRGVRLAELAAGEWREIQAAFHEHALVIFPDQQLGPDEQVAFGRRFGEIEHLYGKAGWVPITNRRGDGSLMADHEPPMQIMRGNEGWHTDSSYMALAAKASVLSARVVPARGGQTEWADMRAAYDALDDALRVRIDALSAYHSIRYSQARIGDTEQPQGAYGFQAGDPPLRPLVKRHPVTGRASLFIGRHAYGIQGLSEAESEQLLDTLLTDACQPPRVHCHQWQVGDVAVWDNRCLLHRARPYDHGEARMMIHTRIAGDPTTERAAA